MRRLSSLPRADAVEEVDDGLDDSVRPGHRKARMRGVANGAVLACPGRLCDGLVKPLAACDLLSRFMLIVHGTRRFRDRVPGVPTEATDQSRTLLGCRYAGLLRW